MRLRNAWGGRWMMGAFVLLHGSALWPSRCLPARSLACFSTYPAPAQPRLTSPQPLTQVQRLSVACPRRRAAVSILLAHNQALRRRGGHGGIKPRLWEQRCESRAEHTHLEQTFAARTYVASAAR